MFEILSDDFEKIIGKNPRLHLLATGFELTEGPVFLNKNKSKEGFFFFTDQRKNHIYCMTWNGLGPYHQLTELSYELPILFKYPANIANGMSADLEGRLIIAEAGGRRLSRIEVDGTLSTLIENYEGKKLNSPNDIIVKSDGSIWFTDPNYGYLGFGSLNTVSDCELTNNVYRFDPQTKELSVVLSHLKNPNGLAFSKDESILYVSDSGACQGYGTYYHSYPHHVYAYDVSPEGEKISNERVLAVISPGFPDGIRIDEEDNLYVTAEEGVLVFNPQGILLGKIHLPAVTTNLTFGDISNTILFICTLNSIWAVQLQVRGGKKVPIL